MGKSKTRNKPKKAKKKKHSSRRKLFNPPRPTPEQIDARREALKWRNNLMFAESMTLFQMANRARINKERQQVLESVTATED